MSWSFWGKVLTDLVQMGVFAFFVWFLILNPIIENRRNRDFKRYTKR